MEYRMYPSKECHIAVLISTDFHIRFRPFPAREDGPVAFHSREDRFPVTIPFAPEP